MAVDLPGDITGVRLQHYLRNRPLISGDAAADKAYGLRGLSSEINHAYAYRVHSLESMSFPESDDTAFFTTGSTALVELATGVYGIHHLCDDVVNVVCIADMVQGYVDIEVNGNNQTGAGVTTRAIDTATLSLVGSGDIGDIVPYRIRVKAQSGQTCELYRLAVYELVLAAGDIP